MRAVASLVVLSVIASAPAFADSWRTKVALLEERSSSNCVDADVSRLTYDLAVTDNSFSMVSSSGEKVSAPVAADGSTQTSFTGSLGRRQFALQLTGNVRTRDIEISNARYSCHFKLMPVR
jgi:hypothetical protein